MVFLLRDKVKQQLLLYPFQRQLLSSELEKIRLSESGSSQVVLKTVDLAITAKT